MTPRTVVRRALLVAALTVPAVLPAAASATTLWPATLQASNTGMWPSMVIPADGRPVIAHYDAANGRLLVSRCNDRACRGGDEAVSALDTAAQTGRASAMVLSGHLPVIAYQYLTGNDLRVARCNDLACAGTGDTVETVDSASMVIGATSIAVPADGFPVISYFDAVGSDLKVMKCNDTACAGANETITTVFSTGTAGLQSAIAIGHDGKPVIAFNVTSAGDSDLWFMRCNDAACAGADETVMPVDTTGDVGDAPAMAVPADGRPVISYHSDGTDHLKVARCSDASCTPDPGHPPQTVDATGNVGDHSAIAVTAAGNPVISYHDTANGDLKLLECNDAACTPGGNTMSVVDADGAGSASSIALGFNGRPVIAYRSDTVSGLRVAASDPVAAAPAGAVDMGSVDAAAGAATATLTVTSSGGTPVTFGTPSVTGADTPAFSVTGGTCAGKPVNAGATCTVTLAFDPDEVGTVTDTLTIPSDDPAGALTRTLTGEGTFTGAAPTPPGYDPPASAPAPGPTVPSTPVAAPALSALTAARGLLTVRATDATTAALTVAAKRPRGAALTRALAACAGKRGAARTRCADAARWTTVKRRTVAFTAGIATLRLGKVRGTHRVTVTLTGPGGTATVTRTLRLR
ncbi:MAG: choice-of-anchor D domain-containing protein [Thermoleophilia bacterium]|nr:choice-of-anchor D domain-containing protein [Thermoleophilia bacterium]